MFSIEFLRAYIITMRPYLLFVSGITGIAGLAFVPGLSVGALTILCAFSFLSYGFGQALTDCFQMDTDALSSPYRPLTRGTVRRGDVLAVSLTGLGVGGVIVTLYSIADLFLALAAIGGLGTYTYFKKRWWGGPWYNAWIVVVLCVITYIAGCGSAGAPVSWSTELCLTLAVVFFGYANFVLSGYFKDVSADRATGYHTLPVVYGLRVASLVSDLFALGALGSCAAVLYGFSGAGDGYGAPGWSCLIFASGGLAASVLAQMRLHKVRSDEDAHRAIAPVVHAYLLLLASIAAAARPSWTIGLAVFYLGFVLTMRIRPMKQQI